MEDWMRRVADCFGNREVAREFYAFRRQRAVHIGHFDLLKRFQRVLRRGEPAKRRQIAERQLDELRTGVFAESENFQRGEMEKTHRFTGGEAVLSALKALQQRQLLESQRGAAAEVFPLEFDLGKARKI